MDKLVVAIVGRRIIDTRTYTNTHTHTYIYIYIIVKKCNYRFGIEDLASPTAFAFRFMLKLLQCF